MPNDLRDGKIHEETIAFPINALYPSFLRRAVNNVKIGARKIPALTVLIAIELNL